MTEDEFLPQALFISLRKAGFPLGTNEYKLLMEALADSEAFGINDLATLKKFCAALWVKSPEDKLRFDTHFDQIIARGAEAPKPAPVQTILTPKTRPHLAILIGGLILVGIAVAIWANLPKQPESKPIDTSVTPIPKSPIAPSTPPTPTATPETVTIVEPLKNNPQEWIAPLTLVGIGMASSSLILWFREYQRQQQKQAMQVLPLPSQILATLPPQATPDYFPVTPRQMRQAWRYWRCIVPSGASSELDIDATVRSITRHGFFLYPVLSPRRVNRSQLMLLIDVDSSMVPFLGLCQQLARSAVEEGRLNTASVYYFRACPHNDYLYQDEYCVRGTKLELALGQLQPPYAGVLIISDGGAMRGKFEAKRWEKTQEFLGKLGRAVKKVAWLNPLPPHRWTGTTAAEIAQQVPMFEFTRQELEKAILVLRGKV